MPRCGVPCTPLPPCGKRELTAQALRGGEDNLTVRQNLRLIFAAVMVTLMVLAGELTGEKEIIFPEAAALFVGACVMKKSPWRVDKIRMMIVMPIAAAVGLGISVFLDMPMYFRVMSGLVVCVGILLLSRTTMLPLLSACVLPIMTNAKSPWYIVSVATITLAAVLLQLIMEKTGLRKKRKFFPVKYSKKAELLRWSYIIAVFSVVVLFASGFNVLYIAAPPIIVAFCEFSYSHSPARRSPVVIFCMTVFCSFLGAASRLLMCETLGLPLWSAAAVTILCVLYSMQAVKIFFPPTAALAILPMIIPSGQLLLYPIEVTAGAALLISLAMLLRIPNNRSRRTENKQK